MTEKMTTTMNDIQLMQGDCLDLMRGLEEKSIDLILCDLPFGTTKNKWDTIIPFGKLWEQYERIIKPKGNIVLFGTGLFAFKLALSNEKLFRYDMIWKKSKCGSPFTAKYMPMKKHELILVFGKSAAYYESQLQEGKPYHRKNAQYSTNNFGFGLKNLVIENEGTRHPSTVLDFPQKWRRQDQVHPTQKPVELIEFLVKSYCPENGVVLDNCMGSGSTGIACVNTNRKFIGMELDEKYFKIAEERIKSIIP